ncbi:MAG: HAD-IC family P-type ATPase [Alphaproteobacteria bacterium]
MTSENTKWPELPGLGADDAAARAAAGLSNKTSRQTSRSLSEILRTNIFTRFNAILGTLAIVMLALSPRDALFGLPLIFNSAIGIVQELRAKRTLDRLSLIAEAKPRIRRDGIGKKRRPEEIVADDLVELSPGEAIFTDGEIVAVEELEIDESLLSGESDPVIKRVGESVLSGSFAVAGIGLYRAPNVGGDTYAAKLTAEATRFSVVQSELQGGINRLLRIVQWLMIPTAILLAISQFSANDTLSEAIINSVAGVVPMIPEGLVLLTSMAFAIAAIRLARRNCLIQELPAVEVLARVDVTCVDKTGTLTEDRMSVREIIQTDSALPTKAALGALAAADPSPNASVRAIADAAAEPMSKWSVIERFPFSSARKWSGATFDDHGTWLLGAPDVLLSPTDPSLARARDLAGQGLRVLAVATAPAGLANADLTAAILVPAALVVLEQKIRPDAAATLQYFRDQGVSVKVLSGDDPRTVGSVAARLGLAGAENPVDARSLSDDRAALAEAMDDASVFGRVAPGQKREMVRALQEKGHVVAMTGDGVNDVLALKDADIGVAMGAGSDAAKAVARVVLLDNQFASLPFVLGEGRRVLANMERVAHLFLSKTVYATVLALAIGVVGLTYPFLPRHITLVGSLTIGIPAFFLALAPNADLARPGFVPRVLALAIPAGIVAAIAALLAYQLALWRDVGSLEEHRTTATITLFVVAGWVLAVVSRPLNAAKIGLVAAMFAGFIAALVIQPINDFFALPLGDTIEIVIGVFIALAGSSVIYAFTRSPWLERLGAILARRPGR